ncbi:MAG: outer membrane beta-barrel protein [Pseudomonadota bacterium]
MKTGFLTGAAVLALGLAAMSTPASAADKGIYLGATAGFSSLHDNVLDYDSSATGYKIIAGWRFIDWLAIEANYVDFGSGSDTVAGQKIKTDGNGVSLSALAFLPVGPVDLYARVGAFDWSANAHTNVGKFGDNGTDLVYGAGAQFRLGGISLRGEYERFDLSGTDADLFSLGLTYTFF